MALSMVEVAYSYDKDQIFFVALQVPTGSTAADVLKLSGLFQQFPELHHTTLDLGVFATRIQADYQIQPGDRIVVYRSLRMSPMEARQRRAQKK